MHIDTSQLICIKIQLTGFYLRGTLTLNALKKSLKTQKITQGGNMLNVIIKNVTSCIFQINPFHGNFPFYTLWKH